MTYLVLLLTLLHEALLGGELTALTPNAHHHLRLRHGVVRDDHDTILREVGALLRQVFCRSLVGGLVILQSLLEGFFLVFLLRMTGMLLEGVSYHYDIGIQKPNRFLEGEESNSDT